VLVEAVFKVGCDAGVVSVVLFNYIDVPHQVFRKKDFPRSKAARDKLTRSEPIEAPRVGLEPTT